MVLSSPNLLNFTGRQVSRLSKIQTLQILSLCSRFLICFQIILQKKWIAHEKSLVLCKYISYTHIYLPTYHTHTYAVTYSYTHVQSLMHTGTHTTRTAIITHIYTFLLSFISIVLYMCIYIYIM